MLGWKPKVKDINIYAEAAVHVPTDNHRSLDADCNLESTAQRSSQRS